MLNILRKHDESHAMRNKLISKKVCFALRQLHGFIEVSFCVETLSDFALTDIYQNQLIYF